MQNKDADQLRHTCDTFMNPNREIWNFWSGNLCLVLGGFHVANFGLFFTEVTVVKSSDIARNMLPSITMLTYANRNEKMRLFTVYKAPTNIILTRTSILVDFVSFC